MLLSKIYGMAELAILQPKRCLREMKRGCKGAAVGEWQGGYAKDRAGHRKGIAGAAAQFILRHV